MSKKIEDIDLISKEVSDACEKELNETLSIKQKTDGEHRRTFKVGFYAALLWMKNNELKKYESKEHPGLFYWADTTDPEGIIKGSKSFMIVSQVDGSNATEAFDTWFKKLEDADEIAQRLANGERI